jgi:hypothetical protein
MSRAREGLVRSIQVRLARHAKEIGVDPNLVLTRFAIERFLYRLSLSPHAERFVLKGGLLLLAWLGESLRPTRDADVLGLGDLSAPELTRVFAEICTTAVETDAMIYHLDTIQVSEIRQDDAYGGKRVTIRASLGSARPLRNGWSIRVCSGSRRPGCAAIRPRSSWPRRCTRSRRSGLATAGCGLLRRACTGGRASLDNSAGAKPRSRHRCRLP